jgi:hypothetical protein
MNPVVIVLGIVLLILVYILYSYTTNTTTSLTSQADLNKQPISAVTIPNPTNTRYAYSLWVFVNSWSNAIGDDSGNSHNLFFIKHDGGNPQNILRLYLDSTAPVLKCDFGMNTNTYNTVTITNNFPIQKWTYVTISVDNQFVDCYLDGKLIKSSIVADTNGNPPLTGSLNTKLNIGNSNGTSFNALIAKFQFNSSPLDPQTVWTNYLSGNGMNSLTSSNYGLNVSVLRNNAIQNVYTLF